MTQNDFSGACSPSQSLNIHHKKTQSISRRRATKTNLLSFMLMCSESIHNPVSIFDSFSRTRKFQLSNFQLAPLLLNIQCIRDVNISYAPQFPETAVHQHRQPELIPRRKVWHRSFDSLLPLCCTATSIPTMTVKLTKLVQKYKKKEIEIILKESLMTGAQKSSRTLKRKLCIKPGSQKWQ